MDTKVRSFAWPARILLSGTIASCLTLVAFAQPVETPVPKTERIGKIAELVKQGQLGMAKAVQMAEKHTKGVAFRARCAVRPGPFEVASNDAQPTPPKERPDIDEERLMYDIICVVRDKPIHVKIDGKDKKVLSPKTPPTPPPGPGPTPKPGSEPTPG